MAVIGIDKIKELYNPAWKGETEGGEEKRIYTIIGPIAGIAYRLMDKNGIYLNDVDNNELFAVISKYRIK